MLLLAGVYGYPFRCCLAACRSTSFAHFRLTARCKRTRAGVDHRFAPLPSREHVFIGPPLPQAATVDVSVLLHPPPLGRPLHVQEPPLFENWEAAAGRVGLGGGPPSETRGRFPCIKHTTSRNLHYG